MTGPQQIVIDPDVCIGAGACELLAPDRVVVGSDGVARLCTSGPIPADTASALVHACPSGALTAGSGEQDRQESDRSAPWRTTGHGDPGPASPAIIAHDVAGTPAESSATTGSSSCRTRRSA